MGSVRPRVVPGQAAAVPGVHATPWVFLVVAVATLGALAWPASQPASHSERSAERSNLRDSLEVGVPLPPRVKRAKCPRQDIGSEPRSLPACPGGKCERGDPREAELAVEFKFEPDHQRAHTEFPPTKFPVVDWKEVVRDTQRVQEFVQQGFLPHACSLFVDEGGHLADPRSSAGSCWTTWQEGQRARVVSVLVRRAGPDWFG